MQIVIDIPDKKWELIQDNQYCGIIDDLLYQNIKNGTPLPKGHGDLIDRNVAREVMMFEMSGTGYQGMAMHVLDSEFYTPTIIEADKSESGE